MSKHALLGASSSKMWLNCVGSARLNEKFADKSSEYAEEGTTAHALGECFLRYKTKDLTVKQFNQEFSKIQKNKWFTKEMADHCNDYSEYVMDLPGDVLLIEQRLDYSNYVPEGFGTGDAIKVDDGVLNVVDLKYGKGVKVEAEDNTQLKFYALGAINALQMLFDFERVVVHIFQPRLGDPTTAEYTVDEILKWAETIREPAQMAWDGVEEYKAGDWCKFCKAKATCRTRMENEAKAAFDDVFTAPEEVSGIKGNELTEDEITYWLGVAKPVIKFLTDLQDYALDQAENHGKRWTGYKLVEGRSNRQYADKDAIIRSLDENNAPAGYMTEPELVGVTAMEKLLGKKKFRELVEPFLVKAPGKPTLVPESDNRPEINSNAAAQEAFKEE